MSSPSLSVRPSRKRIVRLAATAFAIAVLAALAVWILFAASGWVRTAEDALSSDHHTVELSHVRVRLFPLRVTAERVAVYPRGVVCDALLTVNGLCLTLRPSFGRPDPSWIREVACDALHWAPGPSAPVAKDVHPSDPLDVPPVPVRCGVLDLAGLVFRDIRADVSLKQGEFRVACAGSDVQGPDAAPQHLSFLVAVRPTPFRLSIDASGAAKPETFLPFFRALNLPGLVRELSRFSFPAQAPTVHAFALRCEPDAGIRSLHLSLNAGPCAYNGVPLKALSSTIAIDGDQMTGWSPIQMESVHLVAERGSVDASLSVDLTGRTLAFEADSSIAPADTLTLARIALPTNVCDALTFPEQTVLHASGVYDWNPGTNDTTDIRLSLLAPSCAVHGMPMEGLRLSGVYRDGALDLTSIDGKVFGGFVSGALSLWPDPAGEDRPLRASARLAVSRLSQNLLLEWLKKPASGDDCTIDGSGELQGPAEDLLSGRWKESEGTLKLDIRDGYPYKFPLLSGAVGILSKVVPGVGLLTAQDFNAEANLRNAVLTFQEIESKGTLFSIYGKGTIGLDKTLDLRFKVNLFNHDSLVGKGVGLLLSPITSIFGVKATGTVSDPMWESTALSTLGF